MHAQVTIYGGKGMLRVYDAENVFAGKLYINPNYSIFLFKDPDAEDLNTDHTLNLSMTFGISRIFELLIHTVPYQDNQRQIWGPIGDTEIGLKINLKMQSIFQCGLLAQARLPTAPISNVQYESFRSERNSWLLLGLMNIDFKMSSAAIPLKMSFNLGYRDLDWYDRFFEDNKDQLVYGFGFKFPIRTSQIFSEFSGEYFMNSPVSMTLSQNLLRFTQGVRFVGPSNLIFDIAADISFGAYKPTRQDKIKNPLLKEYADWKVIFGISYNTTLFNILSPDEKLEKERQLEEMRKLEEIKKQREKVAKELQELKKEVEKETETKPPY